MSISFVQLNKTYFSADFELHHEGDVVGTIHFQSGLDGKYDKWTGDIMGHQIILWRSRDHDSHGSQKTYRILVDKCVTGQISQTKHDSCSCRKIDFDGRQYIGYVVCPSEKEYVQCLFWDRLQVAEIEKEQEGSTKDYGAVIVALDEMSAFVTCLLACYDFSISYFVSENAREAMRAEMEVRGKKAQEIYRSNFKLLCDKV